MWVCFPVCLYVRGMCICGPGGQERPSDLGRDGATDCCEFTCECCELTHGPQERVPWTAQPALQHNPLYSFSIKFESYWHHTSSIIDPCEGVLLNHACMLICMLLGHTPIAEMYFSKWDIENVSSVLDNNGKSPLLVFFVLFCFLRTFLKLQENRKCGCCLPGVRKV